MDLNNYVCSKFYYMFNLVLFGPPGAGKGTQAEKLMYKYQLKHLSTGDLLRAEIEQKTDLGLKAKKLMDQGELVPDEVVIGMIEHQLDQNSNSKGFIFDGFPRTAAQAEALDSLLNNHNTSISMMISLEVEENELTRRLLDRGKVSGRSDDQNADIIHNRIVEYKNKTAPVKSYYDKQGKCVVIDGIGSIEQIFHRLCESIDHVQVNK